MTDTKQIHADHHILELLPWYVNGTLSENEKAEVDTYLTAHPEYLQEIELLQNLQQGAEEKIAIPAANTNKLMHKLDALEQTNNGSLADKVSQLVEWLFAPKLVWATVPVALALAVALLWIPSQTDINNDFQTLSSGENTGTLSISINTSGNNENLLIEKIQKLAPAAKISAESNYHMLITISEEIKPEESLKLLESIQSLPTVESAELITSNN